VAEDLTPPEPERAPDVASAATAAVEAAPATPVVEPPRRAAEPRPFRYRFGLAYLVLAVVAGVGVGAAIILLDREPTPDTTWSTWKPSGREGSYPSQIADFVSGRYRHPETGRALVSVMASQPQVQTQEGSLPIQAVAIQNDPEGSNDDITVVSTEDGSLMYTLCGLGERCSIREGAPSVERARLLRRESLELALYSFKYMDLKNVIVLMPPNLGRANDASDDRSTALFFEKSDFKRELARPLQRTLNTRVRPTPQMDGLTINRLTDTRTFLYQFTQTPAGFAVIVLAPLLQ